MTGFKLTGKQAELARQIATPAKHHLFYGGSRSGKTFLFVWAIVMRALKAPGSRHAIFRRHGVAVKQSIGRDTLPKVMDLAYPGVKYVWREQDGYFELPAGSEIWLAGLDDKERVDKILGREYSTLYFNEASELPYASYLVAQTRLAQNIKRSDGKPLPLKIYVDLNPTVRQHWTYRLYVDGVEPESNRPVEREDYAVGVANPADNAENLDSSYLRSLENLPDRARRRFWDGVYSADAEGALWRRDMLQRVAADRVPDLTRIVVSIDPAASTEMGSDETGIVCVGLDAGGNGYVLADDSGKYSPQEWARRSLALYEQYDADAIIAERNNGGDMVESTIRAQQRDAPVRLVWASRGKVTRAEPVAALYERKKVYHAGEFTELEDQMCAMTIAFDRKSAGFSPDRVDALVWGFTELFPQMTRKRVTSTRPERSFDGWAA